MMYAAIFIVLLYALPTFGQQPTPQQQPNQPIELPEFVVTGKDRVDIPASSKQSPTKPPVLKGARLDSLNDLEKQPMPTLPADPLPSLRRPGLFYPGFVDASFGQYLTPAVASGYTFTTGGYRVDVNGDLELSNGHRDNADYTKIDLRALSTYVAPQKFIVFGGSTTEADVRFRSNAYRLFAMDTASERQTMDLRVGLEVNGSYEGYRYEAGAAWSYIDIGTGTRTVLDNMIGGYASVDKRWNDIDVGGRLDMQFRSFSGDGYPFLEGSAYGRYSADLLRLSTTVGLQSATSTTGIMRGGLLIHGIVDVFAGRDLTFTGVFRSGLRSMRMQDLLLESPYIVDTSLVLDASYDVVDLSGMVLYHPNVRFTASVGMKFTQRDRHPVWVGADGGMFMPEYRTVTLIRIPGQLRWLVSSRDVVTADMEFTVATVNDMDDLPYVPSLRASIVADRMWAPDLSSTIAIVYVGDRWADLRNTTSLSGYIDVRLSVRLEIAPAWQVRLEANNLLGSDIILWDGYLERGMFIRAGILWRF